MNEQIRRVQAGIDALSAHLRASERPARAILCPDQRPAPSIGGTR